MTHSSLLPTFVLLAACAAPVAAWAQTQEAAKAENKAEAKEDYGTLITPGDNSAPSRVEVVSADVINVGVDESVLESTVSLTLPVLDEAGRTTTLQGLAAGRPIVLQFGYYRCPVVCPQILGNLGDVAGWSADARGTWPLVRGVSAHPSGTPRTATGVGTSLQLGALAEGQNMYANLHVLSVSGTAAPTLTMTVHSDNATGFPSTTLRGSFAAKTAVGGESIRIAGPITDDWWRLSWTISGTNPSFLFLVSMGIE
jgi:hypothetical protein